MCVCMFIMSKALLISSATVIVRAGGVIWLNTFATVLFSACSAVTVVLCFVPVLHGCVWYVCCYVREEGSFSVSDITERGDMGMYEVPLSVSSLGFGIGTMLANFHV